MKTTLEIHTSIATGAAFLANRDVQYSPQYQSILAITLGNEVYRPSSEDTLERSISLTWDQALDQSPPEVIDELRRVGEQAIHDSIVENKDLFVGLILGHARNGDNYFELFK